MVGVNIVIPAEAGNAGVALRDIRKVALARVGVDKDRLSMTVGLSPGLRFTVSSCLDRVTRVR